jgi:hypothetical protein
MKKSGRVTGRIFKTGAVATAILLATVGVAFAAQTQTVDIYVSPKALPKLKMAPVALKIHTATGDSASPNGIPSPAVRALINFDDDIAVNFRLKGLGRCSPESIAGLSTDQAKATCPRSIVGGGAAKVRIPWPNPEGYVELPAVVTAFNATTEPGTGRPRVILYSRQEDTGQGSSIIGVFKKSSAGADYGRLLDVDIPLLLDGNAALTDFRVTIGNGYKKGFVKARCFDRNRRMNMKTRFFYDDGTSLPASDYAVCKRK